MLGDGMGNWGGLRRALGQDDDVGLPVLVYLVVTYTVWGLFTAVWG